MTSLLLDTHVAIWLLAGINISAAVRETVQDARNDVYLSVASPWEVAIKQSSGKFEGLPEDYLDLILNQGVDLLGILPEHVRMVRHLPFHHRDPFDRMLVAQAQVEKLTLVTRDTRLGMYDVEVLAA